MRDSLIKLMPWMGGKGQLMWAIQMLLPIHYKTLVDVFGGSGIITLNTAVPKGCLQIYNDLNHDLYNLLFCVKHRPMALTKELSFLPINARDEFDVLRRQLQGEDFTQLYLDEELQLAEQMFPPPEAEEVKRLLQSRAELSDVRRAAAIYKLQRYSYNGNGDSYGVSSCDIQRFFRDIWECSHRLKDVALENKDFESIITTHNDPQTTVYCDPPYYEAERYAVEFPRSDHQRLHDVLAQHRGFAMVSYNNCDYIRRLYEDFFIYEVERPNSQSKKKNDIYREYIMTNYDPRVFASQMTIFGDYSSDGKICRLVHIPERPLRTRGGSIMKNEMTLDKTGLTIPGSELAECGMAGVDLSAQMTHSLLLLMPREMTALQTADALAGLFDAASQLVSALLDACRMPCCKNCDSDVREFDLDAVPAPIRKLLLDSGCCPALLECYLEEGDVVYAAE